MNSITITAMCENHLDAVIAIEKEVFSDPWSHAMFFQDLHADYGHCYVALEGDAVIGYADAWFVCDECTLNRIAFSKKNQRTGNGSLMLKFVLDKALCRGVEKFFLEVRATNTAALLFYKKAGFIQVGLRKEYYSDTSDNAVLMSLIVRNHVQAFRNDR